MFGVVALILILGAFLLVASLQPRPYPGYYWAPFGGFGFGLFGIVLLFAVVYMVIRFTFWGAMVHRGAIVGVVTLALRRSLGRGMLAARSRRSNLMRCFVIFVTRIIEQEWFSRARLFPQIINDKA